MAPTVLSPSIAVLLVLNLVLGVAALLIRPGAWIRGRRRAQFAPDNRDGPAILDALAAAQDADPNRALSALSEIAAHPEVYVSGLVSLIELSATASGPVRFGAIRAVRSILAVEPALLSVCWPDVRPLARRAVLAGIADHPASSSSDASLTDVVRGAVVDADPVVRRHACAALPHIDSHTALSLATQVLDDDDAEVRRLTIAYLAEHGGISELTILVDAVVGEGRVDRAALVHAAGAIGRCFPQALLALTSVTTDDARRLAAIAAVGSSGSMALASELATALGDRSRDLRRASAAAIANAVRVHAGRRLPDEIVQALAARLERETSKSVLLAVLDAVEVSADARLHAVLARRAPHVDPAILQRVTEVIAELEAAGQTDESPVGRAGATGGGR